MTVAAGAVQQPAEWCTGSSGRDIGSPHEAQSTRLGVPGIGSLILARFVENAGAAGGGGSIIDVVVALGPARKNNYALAEVI